MRWTVNYTPDQDGINVEHDCRTVGFMQAEVDWKYCAYCGNPVPPKILKKISEMEKALESKWAQEKVERESAAAPTPAAAPAGAKNDGAPAGAPSPEPLDQEPADEYAGEADNPFEGPDRILDPAEGPDEREAYGYDPEAAPRRVRGILGGEFDAVNGGIRFPGDNE